MWLVPSPGQNLLFGSAQPVSREKWMRPKLASGVVLTDQWAIDGPVQLRILHQMLSSCWPLTHSATPELREESPASTNLLTFPKHSLCSPGILHDWSQTLLGSTRHLWCLHFQRRQGCYFIAYQHLLSGRSTSPRLSLGPSETTPLW